MGSQLNTILGEIKDAIETVKTGVAPNEVVKYKVSKNKIDERLVKSTEIPAVLVSSVRTVFGKQNFKIFEETLNISLMIIVDRPVQSDNTESATQPFPALVTAQSEIIKTLVDQFVYQGGTFNSVISKDSFELIDSSISNAVKQHNFGGAITCMVGFTCKAMADFSI